MHFSGYELSNSYPDIHNAGKWKDKNYVKVGEEVSVGGEGGEEEADEGDAAEVGGSRREQAKEQLYCSHPLSYLIQSFFHPWNWAVFPRFSDSYDSSLQFVLARALNSGKSILT